MDGESSVWAANVWLRVCSCERAISRGCHERVRWLETAEDESKAVPVVAVDEDANAEQEQARDELQPKHDVDGG